MDELRFDGRVAVITGAGRGLGRAYALLLASRGARVVVNDVGGSLGGGGCDAGPADEVVREIRELGGEAVSSTDSVATAAGGRAIIDGALGTYGRIDVLIHNAGITRRAPIRDMTEEQFDAVLDVHLRGAFHVARAAFPRMCDAGYGRIVLTSSIGGLYGERGVANYCAAKAGVIGLANVLALEGATSGVTCNIILPVAVTRMAEGRDTSSFPDMPPDLVAPAVAWLAHEACPLSGEMLISAAGRLARAFVVETAGVYQPSWTIEQISEHMLPARQTDGLLEFPVLPKGFYRHLDYSFNMSRNFKTIPMSEPNGMAKHEP